MLELNSGVGGGKMPLRRIVVDPTKVLSGYTIASVTGTIPNMTVDLEVEGINVSSIDTVAKITLPQGYYDSSSRIKLRMQTLSQKISNRM